MQTQLKPVKLLTIISDRSNGKKVVALLNKSGYALHFAFLGHGTAPDEMSSYFGLNESEKAVIVLMTGEENVQEIFTALRDEFGIGAEGNGIAFSINVNSASSIQAVQFMMGLNNGGQDAIDF